MSLLLEILAQDTTGFSRMELSTFSLPTMELNPKTPPAAAWSFNLGTRAQSRIFGKLWEELTLQEAKACGV